MSNYWKKKLDELNEENAKKSSSTTTKTTKTTKSKDYWGDRLTELEKANKKKEDEDEIAPVLTSKKDKDDGLDFFQKGGFADGYQFGDVTKTILGTALDVGVGVGKGVAKLGEGIVDAGRYGVAGLADALGKDDFADRQRVKAMENVIDKTFEKTDAALNEYSVLGRTSDSVMEGFGQIGAIILTGGVAGAAGAGAIGATAATTGVMGVSSLGSGMSEAYLSGATDEEAATYGLIKGVVDAGSELIFGGLGKAVKAVGLSKGLTSMDDVFARKLADRITSQTAKNFVQYGVKASAEGVEEVLAGIGSIAGKKLTYMDEAELSALVADENLLEQFVVGAVTSGVAQSGLVPGMKSGSLMEANKTGRDFITGNSVNEQKVIDKEYENRINEQEQDGRKLTEKEKSKIYDAVVSDMEKGYISTDTIEEVLGGDTYKAHKDTLDAEKAMQEEYDTLYKMKNGEKSDEQIDRQAELKQQLDDLKQNFNRNELRESVMSLVKNDRLAESYNERTRRGQAFEADITKYDSKQQAVIQKAVESGILNNTNRTHEFVDMIAKISADKGVLFDFTNNAKLKESGFAIDGKTVNGFVNENGVSLNIDSAKSLNSVVGHEITHVLEGTQLYTELQKVIVDYAKHKGDYKGRMETIQRLYKGQKNANLDAELTADLVGDYLFTDSDFIHNLSTNHRNVFQKVYDEVKYLCKVATAGSKEARELEKVKRAFEQAYKGNGKVQTDTKHSLSDSEGVKLSKEQREYFKDSKVRDENGNLKVMYHGTPNAEFTVFKDGTYFTDSKEYADRYQNPSASSISSGKVASNPKTFEVYLDIKKPFDIADEEARNIYINDYIKGGNALGINPYLSDAEYDKISTIDWTEGEDLRDFLIENDYDYDGLVLDEGGTGGYGDAVEHRGKSYVVFSPEQVKNTDNLTPTEDADIRYSLSEDKYAPTFYSHMARVVDGVKQEKLGAASVVSMLRGKGVKAEEIKWSGIEQFLEGKKSVTKAELQEFIAGSQLQIEEETLDNKEIDYTEEQSAKIAEYTERHHAIMDEIAAEWKRIVGQEFPHNRAANINSDDIERDIQMAAATIADSTPEGVRFSEVRSRIREMISDNGDFGFDRMAQAYRSLAWNPENFIRNFDVSEEDATLIREFAEAKRVMDGVRSASKISEQDADKLKSLAKEANAWMRKVSDIKSEYYAAQSKRMTKWGQYKLDGGQNYREYKFKMPDSEYSNQAMVNHWGENSPGVLAHARVQDFDTPDGKMLFIEEIQSDWHNEGAKEGYADEESKGFTQLTLGEYQMQSNGVPIAEVTDAYGNTYAYVMKHNGKYVVDLNGGNRLDTFQNEDDALHALKAQAQYDVGTPDAPFRKSYHEYVLKKLIREAAENGYDSIGWTTADIQSERWSEEYAEGYRIEYDQDIPKFLSKYGKKWGAQVGKTKVNRGNREVHSERIEQLRRNIAGWRRDLDMTVDESEREFIQSQIDYERAELDSIINSGDEVWTMTITPAMKQSVLYEGQPKYSVSDNNRRTFGNYNVYGKDIGLETAPTVSEMESVQDIAPVATSKMETTTEDSTAIAKNVASKATSEDIAPMPEPIPGQFDSLTDEDAPVEMDAPYYGNEEAETTVDDPFENRYMDEVGNPKVKAYMYENPEVKPFFQQEAAIMLRELQESTKGEKLYNDKLYYDTNGEQGWFGQTRNTSEQIAYLLDGGWGGKGYTYAEIEKGLKAIIEDNGKENNACSKRIEFMLNDRLKDGYTDFRDGTEIPPDDGYVALLNEKQITEYSKEAFDALVAMGEEFVPPVSFDLDSDEPAPAPEPVLPKDNEVGGSTKKNPKGQQRMTPKPKPGEGNGQQRLWNEKTARILPEEPKKNKNQRGLWSMFKEYVLDNGMIFEDLSLKTGNRELQAKWNFIRNASSMAQTYMGKGKDGTRALNDIRQEVEKSGKMQAFSEYAYHMLNVDRMTLAQRYEGMENKPVFGYHVTAAQSASRAVQLERANPEFKKWAQELYDINTQLREMLVEGNVLSRETADQWAEMYPHYIPIRRAGYEGAAINVALDTKRTGVNAPIKKATGGNRDILPLFDTMGQRAIQTHRAIAKNRFGLELRKTLGTTISEETAGMDSVIDSMDNEEGLLKKGDRNNAPTFTVFENGKRYTFEITDEMYESMKPTSDLLAYTNPVASAANNAFRGLLTEYNPVFMLSNAVKDAQDVLINSQHPARTYMAMPKAIGQMMSGGNYYREYMENGGEQNTYFDSQTDTFDTKDTLGKKLLGIPPLKVISWANNVIERLPRMAEYIASREDGRSIEVSMLDAARVTTNFAAGGKITKALNRNGATFLNASVQGAVQQARNIREAKANGLKGVISLAAKVAIAGLPSMLVNHLLWDDDEDYEELSDYVKQSYYIVGKYGDGQFVRIPKGRMLAVIQNGFEQMENLVTGDDEVDLKAFLELAVSNIAPNNPVEDNIIAPIIQVKNNETWYGEDLIPTRLADLPKEEQFDESTDAISKWLGEKQSFLSPYQINYLLDQYSGGVGDVVLPMLTPEAESGDNSALGNFLAPLKKKFTTDAVMNNQNVSDFYDTKDELATNAKRRGATDEDVLKSKYFNSINSELSDLYAQKREIQNGDLPDDAKYQAVRDIQNQIVELTKEALNDYPNVSISGDYAAIGNRQYRRNDSGEWVKVTDKQAEKQDEVMGGLDISASEYWGNKGEYDFAYEYPEKYQFFKDNGISYEDYSNADEDGKRAYSWAYENPGKFTMSKAISDDFMEYYNLKTELGNMKGEDNDGDGRSDPGTKKEKVLDYINGLDLDYGQKIILYRSMYSSKADKNDYNMEIVNYLNSRADISEEDMETILKELDFEVDKNGNISW